MQKHTRKTARMRKHGVSEEWGHDSTIQHESTATKPYSIIKDDSSAGAMHTGAGTILMPSHGAPHLHIASIMECTAESPLTHVVEETITHEAIRSSAGTRPKGTQFTMCGRVGLPPPPAPHCFTPPAPLWRGA